MDEMTFEIVKLVLTLAITLLFGLITKVLIPWIREKIGNEQMYRIEDEVERYVLSAQQQLWDKPGADRRYVVTNKIRQYLEDKGIDLTDEQVRDLIEAAVKAMNIQIYKEG